MKDITTITFDGYKNGEPWLIYKYPREQLIAGSRLVVKQGQEALIFRGKKDFDVYQFGTYMINIENVQASASELFITEIYFVNITSKLDMNWGTQTPFQLEDPKYGLILSIRSYGRYGLRIQNSRMFVSELIGSVQKGGTIDYMMIASYFSALLSAKIKTVISKFMIQKQISFLEVTAYLDELSEQCQTVISDEFDRFGVEIQNFYIASITPLKEDYLVLQKYKQEMALGSDVYEMNRSFQLFEEIARRSEHASFEDAGKGIHILRSSSVTNNGKGTLGDSPFEGSTFKNSSYCPGCGTENAYSMKYCGNCGLSLTITCGKCAAVCRPGQRYCGSCGAEL